MTSKTLQQIGEECNTDKATLHSYLPLYEQLILPARLQSISLLEIGVRYGGSLRMWREWLPNAEIVGIDKDERKIWGDVPGCHVIIGDATDPKALPFTNGYFDIIIDDGSHNLWDQMQAWLALWPLLSDGGAYFIEDVRISNIPQLRGLGFVFFDRRPLKDVPDDILGMRIK